MSRKRVPEDRKFGFESDLGDDIASVLQSEAPPALVASLADPELTVDRMFRGTADALVSCFVHEEKRVHGIRKRTRAAWTAAYADFLRQPR